MCDHGAVGFGVNLLAVPVLAILDPAFVPGPAVAAGLAPSILIVVPEPASVDPRLGWAVGGLLPGNALALLLLAAVPSSELAVPTGILVLLAVVLSAVKLDLTRAGSRWWSPGPLPGSWRQPQRSVGLPSPWSTADRAVRGCAATSRRSSSSPAPSPCGARRPRDTSGPDALEASAVLLPGVVAGFLVSGPLRGIVDRGHTRPAVLTLSALAGTVAIVKGLAAR